ncbi:ABC transporter permease [Cohnella sp. REN36]|uniref:ABC transporter permease n=1 Tax=Cohnella sp. REN36 TaxID=2887347 RepID=UPI001D149655|nr:ABC transporter permease [Cohnella sp. REN36]MCC3372371.1 ABC transporter permease [Cohnella sp. REN36]
MISLYPLIQNETIKLLKKRRFLVILVIVVVLVSVFTYAQTRIAENTRKQLGTTDWRITTQNQIADNTNKLSNIRIPDEAKRAIKVEITRLQYALDKNINPQTPSGVTFTRDFFGNAIGLFLPLLVVILAIDLVSAEHSTGTIKILLTRPVRRWKVLMSKLITLLLFTSLIILMTTLICYAISGLAFGYSGWSMPVITGFQVTGDQLITANAHVIEQWRYLFMEISLCWFSCFVVGCISLMVSVLVRSTAAGMGIMLAALISGVILVNMVASWDSAKYFFMVNLQTNTFLSAALPSAGSPPVPGLTLPFSLSVLAAWALISLVISFSVFTKRDILN